MAKRSSKSSAAEHRLSQLVVSRSEAERLIEEQLHRLDAIEAEFDAVQTEKDFADTSGSYWTWHSFVREMLRRILDTEEMAREFAGIAVGSIGGRQTLAQKVDSRKTDARFARQRLASIKERLPLIPEAQPVERTTVVPLEAVWGNLEIIFTRFHHVARQLRRRHDSRPTLDIDDEYDVQDLLHALLRVFFDDIREEEWTPSYAGGASRIDFLLKAERIGIETKKSRESLSAREIGAQLVIDIAHYQEHPDCESLACFVYDPEGCIGNPSGLENDLSKQHGDLLVKVYVMPKA